MNREKWAYLLQREVTAFEHAETALIGAQTKQERLKAAESYRFLGLRINQLVHVGAPGRLDGESGADS